MTIDRLLKHLRLSW